jgi:hypothetical protein
LGWNGHGKTVDGHQPDAPGFENLRGYSCESSAKIPENRTKIPESSAKIPKPVRLPMRSQGKRGCSPRVGLLESGVGLLYSECNLERIPPLDIYAESIRMNIRKVRYKRPWTIRYLSYDR